MLLTQFLTLGVVTLTTAGGALGGYLYRGRRESKNRLAKLSPHAISEIEQTAYVSPKLLKKKKKIKNTT